MKTVIVNIGADRSISCSDTTLGSSGEHNVTGLKFAVGDPELSCCDFFRLWTGDRYSERLFSENGMISFTVPREVLRPPYVDMELCGYIEKEGTVCYVAKSGKIRFRVETSACASLMCTDAAEPFEAYSLECGRAAVLAVESKTAAEEARVEACEHALDARQSSEAAKSSMNAAEKAASRAQSSSENISRLLSEGEVTSALIEKNSAAEMSFWVGTRAEFGELEAPENNTLYLFTDDNALKELEDKLEARCTKRIAELPALSEILDSVYPVGSVYISVGSTAPEALFGGSWERISDCFLLASGSRHALGSTGGSERVTLSAEELPKHKHTVSIYTSSGSSAGGTLAYSENSSGGGSIYNTAESGGGKAHENMPPYLAVAVWKRIA